MIICTIFLLGCQRTNSPNNSPEDKSDELFGQNVASYTVVTARMLFATQYATTEDGCYETLECSNGTGNVLYTDYDTGRKQFLSSNLSSKFNDESDTSWLESVFGGTSTFIAGEKLYVLKRGKNKEGDSTDKYRTYFVRMNLNGSDHKKFYIPANVVIDEGSVIIFDGEKFYFMAVEYDNSQEKVIATRKILSLEITKGKIDNILEMKKDIYDTLIGGYDNKFILQRIQSESNKETPIIRIVEASVDNVETVVYQKEDPQEAVIVFKEELFAFNSKNNKLTMKNLKTDKEDSIKIEIPNFAPSQSILLVGDFFDRHLFFNVENKETQKSEKYSLQVDTKKMQKQSLYNDDLFVGIYAETKNNFLVITGEKVVTYPALSPDKITYFDENRYVYQLALIDKEDYWSNLPSYRFIEDKVEYR